MSSDTKTRISVSLESFPDKYYTMPISKREVAFLNGQNTTVHTQPKINQNQSAYKQEQSKQDKPK